MIIKNNTKIWKIHVHICSRWGFEWGSVQLFWEGQLIYGGDDDDDNKSVKDVGIRSNDILNLKKKIYS